MGTHAINPALHAKLPYDPVKDFAPISLTHVNPRVLIVGSHLPAKSVAELVALAKSKPERAHLRLRRRRQLRPPLRRALRQHDRHRLAARARIAAVRR